MYIKDVYNYTPSPTDAAKQFIEQGRKEQIKKEVEQLVDDEFARLEEYADEYISDVAADRAERFLKRVLEGDEDAAMALLGDAKGSSRYRQIGCNKESPWSYLINGRLFETSGVTLRRRIVESHAELLRSERIKDLESVVEGLTEQVRALRDELER
jgi:hypothetical protein